MLLNIEYNFLTAVSSLLTSGIVWEHPKWRSANTLEAATFVDPNGTECRAVQDPTKQSGNLDHLVVSWRRWMAPELLTPFPWPDRFRTGKARSTFAVLPDLKAGRKLLASASKKKVKLRGNSKSITPAITLDGA
ncbi:hypothetical protein scyTo_0001967 [Scyliorhinus torazame]|uniref:Uncharacterized protein n=1 Tax=Scyliorhinus torazame TaxID=75743 RepID=A0A401PGY1_SCYTO|nr:hypothetical protein [Scyliorhinus torazame]